MPVCTSGCALLWGTLHEELSHYVVQHEITHTWRIYWFMWFGSENRDYPLLTLWSVLTDTRVTVRAHRFKTIRTNQHLQLPLSVVFPPDFFIWFSSPTLSLPIYLPLFPFSHHRRCEVAAFFLLIVPFSAELTLWCCRRVLWCDSIKSHKENWRGFQGGRKETMECGKRLSSLF